MIKLAPIVQEITIDSRSLKEIVEEFFHSDELYIVREVIEAGQKGQSWEEFLEEWSPENESDAKIIYKNSKNLKYITLIENELEDIDLKGYKSMLAIATFYPEGNQATGDLILFK